MHKKTKKKTRTYIDLFSGCGGLSLGLERAGFNLELAVEKSPMAGETFYFNFINSKSTKKEWENHCSLSLRDQADKKLVVDELQVVLENKEIMESFRKKNIDLVVGGPPCQGFSMAGRRNPNDSRNKLPWQFMEFIEKTKPKAVIMENVVGISRDFSKHNKKAPFNQLKSVLENIGGGYMVQAVKLNAMHYGVPEHRPRMMLLGIDKSIASSGSLYFSELVWRSEFDDIKPNQFTKRPDIVPKARYFSKNIRSAKEAFWDIDDSGYLYDEDHSLYAATYAQEMRSGLGWLRVLRRKPISKLSNHNLRNHSNKIVDRFRLYQVLQKEDVKSKILKIPLDSGLSQLEKRKIVRKMVKDIEFPVKSPDGQVVAKDLKEFIKLIFKSATRKHSQRPIRLDRPSPTVLTLPDDLIHPIVPRIMTVRELARIQSFPDMFIFKSKETTGSSRREFEVPQYTQVGNAVAPLLAYELGKNFIKLLS